MEATILRITQHGEQKRALLAFKEDIEVSGRATIAKKGNPDDIMYVNGHKLHQVVITPEDDVLYFSEVGDHVKVAEATSGYILLKNHTLGDQVNEFIALQKRNKELAGLLDDRTTVVG